MTALFFTFIRSPPLQDLSILDPDDPVCHLGNLFIVRDHHNGLFELISGHFQKSQHILTGSGIQISRRFICKL